ncbi:hypothetical protein, partial [Rhizobium leguminosarum]|uniref:hypothetical protein n=1 Tax=Rhizobium leguminosarum TaxID=384 RepID=UPI0019538F36
SAPNQGKIQLKALFRLRKFLTLVTNAHEALSPQLYRGPEAIFQDPVLARSNLRNCCHDGT